MIEIDGLLRMTRMIEYFLLIYRKRFKILKKRKMKLHLMTWSWNLGTSLSGYVFKDQTDQLSLQQIKRLLLEATFGNNYLQHTDLSLIQWFERFELSSEEVQDNPRLIRFLEDPAVRLMKRDKWKHLTYAEKLYVYKVHIEQGVSISKIWQTYGLSLQTVKRIIKLFRTKENRRNIFSNIRWRKLIESEIVQNEIMMYTSQNSSPFVAANVQEHLNDTLHVIIPVHQIRLFLKNFLGLSYKKGNNRPLNLDRSRQEVLKQLFAVKLAEKLPEIKLLCNLDESTINSNTTNNYSWLKRGVSWPLNNVVFKGSINVISCISSDGLIFSMFKHCTTNSKNLIVFIKFFTEYMNNHHRISPNKIGVILDNCATHRSKLFRDYWAKIGINLYYINAYSPEL